MQTLFAAQPLSQTTTLNQTKTIHVEENLSPTWSFTYNVEKYHYQLTNFSLSIEVSYDKETNYTYLNSRKRCNF